MEFNPYSKSRTAMVRQARNSIRRQDIIMSQKHRESLLDKQPPSNDCDLEIRSLLNNYGQINEQKSLIKDNRDVSRERDDFIDELLN
jgi:hypothetical protein